jgi:hypothetical protein
LIPDFDVWRSLVRKMSREPNKHAQEGRGKNAPRPLAFRLSNRDEKIQACIRIRFVCFLVVVLSLFGSTLQANAGVRIAMADDLEPGRHFLVTTTIFNRGFDGFFTEPLDSCFLTSGQRKDITVLAVKPFLYDRVSADAIHPAYYYDSTKSDKVPFALRSVVLSALRPPSWRHLLDSGAPISKGAAGITPSIVSGHFSIILHRYLPAFDRAGIKEDLYQYLPLLHELAVFAHSEQAYENSKTTGVPLSGMAREKYVESLKMTVERYREELDQRLKEIKAWLALEQNKRVPIHDWMVHFRKADYVHREMMIDSDHKRIEQWLEESSDFPRERTLQWTNAETGIRYTLYLNSRFSAKWGSGWSTVLTVDLNPILGLENNQQYLKKSYPNFYRNAEGMWKLR